MESPLGVFRIAGGVGDVAIIVGRQFQFRVGGEHRLNRPIVPTACQYSVDSRDERFIAYRQTAATREQRTKVSAQDNGNGEERITIQNRTPAG